MGGHIKSCAFKISLLWRKKHLYTFLNVSSTFPQNFTQDEKSHITWSVANLNLAEEILLFKFCTEV